MTDDPFRDDHEAALQRADALERENEQLRRENERLKAAKNKPARKKPKPKPRAPSPAEPDASSSGSWGSMRPAQRRRWLLMRSPIAVGVLALFVGPCTYNSCIEAQYKRELAAYNQRQADWQLASNVRECLRDVADVERREPAHDAASEDPRAGKTGPGNQLVVQCAPMTSTHPALQQWNAANGEVAFAVERLSTYYGGGDWRDDGYRAGPELWGALATARQHRIAALARMRAEFEPIARATELATQKQLALAGDTANWWHLELRMKRDDILDAMYAASDDAGRRRALVDGAKAIVAEIENAPLEVKREVRADNELMGIVDGQRADWDPFSVGYELRRPAWAEVNEKAAVGDEPHEPEGCDGGD